MNKTLVIPIEVTSRELDSRLAIMIQLLNINPEWEILIGVAKTIKQYAREVYVENYVLFENALNPGKLLEEYHKLNVNVVVLDEEGGISTKYMEKNLPRMGYDNDGFNYIKKFFLWGQYNYNTIIKNHKNVDRTKLVITGNPRFDLSKKNYNKYFQKFNYHKNFVLIICAFGTANNIIQLELENYYYSKSNLANEKKTREARNLRKKFQEISMKKYLNGIRELIEKYPSENFIIRCHPLEKIETYRDIFSIYSNVHIDTTGPIQEWLPGCKLMIHNGCTTSIEGYFNGLEPICFMPHYDEEHMQYSTYDISDKVHNKDELIELFEKKNNSTNLWSKDEINKKNKYLKNIIDNIETNERYSSHNIAHEIENLNVRRILKTNDRIIWTRKIIQKIRDIKRIIDFRRYLIIRKMNKRFQIGITGFDQENINKRISSLAFVMGIKRNFTAKKIKKDIFKIQIN